MPPKQESSFTDKINRMKSYQQEIGEQLSQPGLSNDEMTDLSRKYAELKPVVVLIDEYLSAQSEADDLQTMLEDTSTDGEMREMAQSEHDALTEKLPDLEHKIKLALLPKDKADDKSAILEVRAGTGGDEAALFAAELMSMYQRYAQLKGWKFEIMETAENELGGLKAGVANIIGSGAFGKLKFESGVHRVQRVPKTETQGRVHTSAATVAILPEAEEVDIEINNEDLRVDVFRASGPGGQSVNTTDSAVRITHIPTGIIVSQQDEKSQHKNRAKALKILRSRLFDAERQRQQQERDAERKSQVGSGDRSERIRTYNFPQSRVTDHRINLTSHNLDQIVAGDGLDEIIEALIVEDQSERLIAATE